MQPVEVHDLFAHLLRQAQVAVNSVLPCTAVVFDVSLDSRISVVNLSTGQPEVNARSWWSGQKTPSNSSRYDCTTDMFTVPFSMLSSLSGPHHSCAGVLERATQALHLHHGTTWSESIQVLSASCSCRCLSAMRKHMNYRQ